MEHQYPENKHNSDGRHPEGHSSHAQPQQEPVRLKKESLKTSTIAISILLTVSLTLIGFEVIDRKTAPITTQATDRGSKSLLILAHEKEKESAGLITNLYQWDERSGLEPSTQKEINRLQANKINALKRQVIEANQKLHEVKAHLFTKGDPADRARLAEICQELVDKDRKNHEYQDKLAELQSERELREQKINRMEHTIDALAAMTDTQRTTKEQAIFTFQQQVEQLEDSANKEREDHEKALAELQQAQASLKESLQEKMISIKTLEDEIAWQYSILTEKDKEIQKQSQLFTSSENQLNSQFQDLVALLEIETAKSREMASDLEIVQARQKAQEQYSKSLESRLAQAQEVAKSNLALESALAVNLLREYFDLQGLLDVYTHAHEQFSTKNQKLAQLVRDEQKQAESLQKELKQTFALYDAEQQRGFCLEEELHGTAQKVALLHQELKEREEVLASKQQDLETLTYSQASLKDQLHEKINQLNLALTLEQKAVVEKDSEIRELAINLELERTRAQELDHMVKEAESGYRNESELAKNYEIQLGQKAEALVALEDRLQDKHHEIATLKTQINTLNSEFELEKIRSGELHKALVTALDENEADRSVIEGLQHTVDKNTDTLSLLQDRMESKKRTIEDIQQRFDELAIELEGERQRGQELEQALAMVGSQKEIVAEKAKTLESSVIANTHTIVSLQDTLADKQQEIRSLLDQINQVSQHMEQQQALTVQLQYELENALSKHQEEQQTIASNTQQIYQLKNQLEEISSAYHYEKTRADQIEGHLMEALTDQKIHNDQNRSLESSLTSHQQKLNSYEQKVLDQHQMIEDLNRKISTLQHHVELEKSRATAFEKANAKELEKTAYLQQQLEASKNTDVAYEPSRNQQIQELPEALSHTVSKGETLSSISEYYYGTPDRWVEIFKTNRNAIPDKNHLVEGTKLEIPQ